MQVQEGVTLRLNLLPQVYGLRDVVSLETVDVQLQAQDLGGGVTWGLWICDPKYSAWVGSPWGLKTCDFRYRVWECVPGNCGYVNPNAGFGGRSHRRFWIWEPRCCVWESSLWTMDV